MPPPNATGMNASLAISASSVSVDADGRSCEMSRRISSSTRLSLKIRTALIGSPMYAGSRKFLVFTKSPFFSKRTGMTRILLIALPHGGLTESAEISRARAFQRHGSFLDETGRRGSYRCAIAAVNVYPWRAMPMVRAGSSHSTW